MYYEDYKTGMFYTPFGMVRKEALKPLLSSMVLEDTALKFNFVGFAPNAANRMFNIWKTWKESGKYRIENVPRGQRIKLMDVIISSELKVGALTEVPVKDMSQWQADYDTVADAPQDFGDLMDFYDKQWEVIIDDFERLRIKYLVAKSSKKKEKPQPIEVNPNYFGGS